MCGRLFWFAASCTGKALVTGDAVVKLPFGEVHGNLLQDSREFLAIPYAAPPMRFAAPEPWVDHYPGGALTAQKYGPQCPQKPNYLKPGDTISENCLHLNVYAPRNSVSRKPLPVMLWIHGGALVLGTAMTSMFNGSTLASTYDVVVVVMNYRLGIFGFPPTLLPSGKAVANVGFRDQQEAMKWVHNNIKYFNGNPESVMIFGQSAGGGSTMAHVVSPGSAGLFSRAVSESGDFNAIEPLSDGLIGMSEIAIQVGCAGPGDLQCLRQVNMSVLISAYDSRLRLKEGGNQRFVLDGDVVLGAPADLVRQGKYNRVPTVLGTNHDECNAVFFYGGQVTNASQAVCAVTKTFGKDIAEKLLQLYPTAATSGVDNRQILADMETDIFFRCPTHELGQSFASAGDGTWLYSFNHQPTCGAMFLGAYHGAELPFVWNHFPQSGQCVETDAELKFAAKMSALWAGFARDGAMEDAWPQYTASQGNLLKLDLASPRVMDIENGFRRVQCEGLKAAGLDRPAASSTVALLLKNLQSCYPAPTAMPASSDNAAYLVTV